MTHDITFGRRSRHAVAVGLTVLACCSSGCSGCSDRPGPSSQAIDTKNHNSGDVVGENAVASRALPDGVRIPSVGFGGTYRCIRFGATVDPEELKVSFEAGLALGRVGVGVPVVVISIKDHSLAFVPDVDSLELSAELGKYQGIKWSPTSGFSRDIGKAFPTLKGRLIYDFRMELPKSAALSPSGTGQLGYDAAKKEWTFTPSTLGASGGLGSRLGSSGPLASALSRAGRPPSEKEIFTFSEVLARPLPKQSPLPHVFRLSNAGPWLPEKGYTWLNGTAGFRSEKAIDLAVRWNPGESSLFPPHIHASAAEGFWEPDAGYRWPDGSWKPLSTGASLSQSVKWSPGTPSPVHPNVIASDNEGQWKPAPGYTWATGRLTDLSVRPLTTGVP